ncbi:DeoR family transcriptional regulator [Endozoicomonas ascidiicola]|uniref:DeoR family transcriptional regulator n=1 Tax=Endozoicomonas ascidiicola TaxID=1698521 RepID=UPI00082ACA27|nr:DeoR family transcriptional regulator [Endozoicomonas ascidiicola]
MKVRKRIDRLDLELSRLEKLHVQDAAKLLNVSEMTVRRDLRQRDAGDPMLVGGYIVADPARHQGKSYLVTEAGTHNKEVKQSLAEYCVTMVSDGQTLFLDCGSTTEEIAHLIPDDISVTVICNALNIVLRLCHKKNCKIYMTGGEFNSDNLLFNSAGSSILDDFRPDLAFISTAGIDIEHGVTCHNISEVSDKRKALKSAQQKVLVCDSSKLGHAATAYIAEIDDFDILVTNHIADNKLAETLKKHIHTLEI